jgi:GT2 family glycosyltransferase
LENELAIAAILYHPTDTEVAALRALSNWGGRMIVFNNGTTDALAGFSKRTKILGDGTNTGVSKGINAILNQAFEKNGAKFVLFLDQDSIINTNVLQDKWRDILALLAQNAMVRLRESEEETLHIEPVRLLINSGTIFTRSAWEDIGGMDERYFVDGVDYDYSFRLYRAGYSMYAFGVKDLFDHSTLQVGRAVRVLGKKIWIRNYGSRYREIYSSLIRILAQSFMALEVHYTIVLMKALMITLLGHVISKLYGAHNTERLKT